MNNQKLLHDIYIQTGTGGGWGGWLFSSTQPGTAPRSTRNRTTASWPLRDAAWSALPYCPPWALTSAPRSTRNRTTASWPPQDAAWSALPYNPPWALTSAPRSTRNRTTASWPPQDAAWS